MPLAVAIKNTPPEHSAPEAPAATMANDSAIPAPNSVAANALMAFPKKVLTARIYALHS